MTTRTTDDPSTRTSTASPRVALPISAEDARDAIDAIGRSAPEVARTSRDAVLDTLHWIETGSDERVATGAALSLGLAMGLVIGGAPRLLIGAALLPILAFGVVLLDHRRTPRRAT